MLPGRLQWNNERSCASLFYSIHNYWRLNIDNVCDDGGSISDRNRGLICLIMVDYLLFRFAVPCFFAKSLCVCLVLRAYSWLKRCFSLSPSIAGMQQPVPIHRELQSIVKFNCWCFWSDHLSCLISIVMWSYLVGISIRNSWDAISLRHRAL
jgi:hypothetical protein